MVTPQIDWYFEPPAGTRPLDCARCCISATKNRPILSHCGVCHRSVNQTVASFGVYIDYCLDLNIRNTALHPRNMLRRRYARYPDGTFGGTCGVADTLAT